MTNKINTVVLNRKKGQYIYRSAEGEVIELGDSFRFRPVMCEEPLRLKVAEGKRPLLLWRLIIILDERMLDAYLVAACQNDTNIFLDSISNSLETHDVEKVHIFSVKWVQVDDKQHPVMILDGRIPSILEGDKPLPPCLNKV